MKPILIVEDEDILRESLRDWLIEDGYQVHTVAEGEVALRAIAERDFGVIILDLMLPGKNGIEILRQAREKRPYIKGIIITAYPSVQTAVEALKEGAVDYLPKPVKLNELETLIRDNLGPVQVTVKPMAAVAAAPPVVKPELPLVERVVAPEQVEEVIDPDTGKVYLPPCQIACPVGEDIQRTNAMIAQLSPDEDMSYQQIIDIGDEIYAKNPLFTICSYICGLCELECNYKDRTGAIRRKMLKRFVTDYYLPYLVTMPSLPVPTKQKVAVIGGGPGGLMCAYYLARQGYQVTILERDSRLGGALRYIPQYRLPQDVLDTTINNLARIAHCQLRFGRELGEDGTTLDDLRDDGHQVVFIATGTHAPRPLTMDRDVVLGTDLDGVASGLYLLYDMNQGKISAQLYRQLFRHRRAIVVGGGNVAFDVARTIRRLEGEVTVVCLENKDKSSPDGIPADDEEIKGALEERVKIVYSRGVSEIIGKDGRFHKIKCPRCVSVFDDFGFNPKFDRKNSIYIKGDILLVTVGRHAERAYFRKEGLLDERDRFDNNPITLMSNRHPGVFIGGDIRRVGFAAEAMRDGIQAAESIDRYLRGADLSQGRDRDYLEAALPRAVTYQPEPEIDWLPAEERLNFDTFERGFTLEEAVAEAKRCLCCGPCQSCKACLVLGIQTELPQIEVNPDRCSGCRVCADLCSYRAITMAESDERPVAMINNLDCKGCGICVVACPSAAIIAKTYNADEILAEIEGALA